MCEVSEYGRSVVALLWCGVVRDVCSWAEDCGVWRTRNKADIRKREPRERNTHFLLYPYFNVDISCGLWIFCNMYRVEM